MPETLERPGSSPLTGGTPTGPGTEPNIDRTARTMIEGAFPDTMPPGTGVDRTLEMDKTQVFDKPPLSGLDKTQVINPADLEKTALLVDGTAQPLSNPESNTYNEQERREDVATVDQLLTDCRDFLSAPGALTLPREARDKVRGVTTELVKIRQQLLDPSTKIDREALQKGFDACREVIKQAREALATAEALKGQEKTELITLNPDATQVISTITSPDGTQQSDAALSARIDNAKTNLEPTTVTSEDLAKVDEEIAAWVKTQWNVEQWDKKGNWSNAEIVADLLKSNPDANKDELLRKAVVDNTVAKLRKQAAEHHAELERKNAEKAEKESKGWRRALKFVRNTSMGIVGGTIVRHGVQQGLIIAGAQGAHVISGVAGMLAGAAVGGVSGFFRGRAKAESETYAGSAILAEIDGKRNRGEMTRDEALVFYERLLKENKVRGEEDECLRLIDRIAQAKAEAELEAAIANCQALPGETQDQTTARVLRELKRIQIADNGSQAEREQMVQEFLQEKKTAVGKEAWKSAGWSALKWGAFGGVFGALFPAPGLDSQLHARDLVSSVKTPLHIQSSADADNILKEIGNIHEHHKNAAEAGQHIDHLLRSKDLNIKDLERLILSDEKYHELAKRVANQLGLDLTYKVDGHGTLYDFAKEFAQRAHDTANTGGPHYYENVSRGMFHLLSHPQETATHLNQLQSVIAHAGQLDGHDFTAQFIHGGNPEWWPFTGAPALPGGEASNAFSASARDYLMHHPNAPHDALSGLRYLWMANTETPWFPFAAWFLSSTEARELAGKGGNVKDRIKEAADKLLGNKEKEKTESGATDYLRFDKDLSKMMDGDTEELKKNPRYEELHHSMERFNKVMPTMHGRFVFLPGEKPGDKIRAFRVWPLATTEAKPGRKVPLENSPSKQNLHGQTYHSAGNESGRLSAGYIQAIEFDIDEIYTKQGPIMDGPHKKVLEDTGDIPSIWSSAEKAGEGHENTRRTLRFEELFPYIEGNARVQLFVKPEEADIYALLLSQGKIKLNEKINAKEAYANYLKEKGDDQKRADWVKANRQLLLDRLDGKTTDVGDTVAELQRENFLKQIREIQLDNKLLSNSEAVDELIRRLEGGKQNEPTPASSTTAAKPEVAPVPGSTTEKRVGATPDKKAAVAIRYRDNILNHLTNNAALDAVTDPTDRAIRDELVERARNIRQAKPALSPEESLNRVIEQLPPKPEVLESSDINVEGLSAIEMKGLNKEKDSETVVKAVESAEGLALLDKLAVNDTEFKGEVLSKSVIQELLKKYDLAPAHSVTADGKTMLFSKNRFLFHGRLAGVAYLNLNDGTVRPLLYLSSGSQATHRFYPGYQTKRASGSVTSEQVTWFCKGYDQQSLNVPLAFQQALPYLELKTNRMIPEADREKLVVGTTKNYKGTEAIGEQPKIDTEVTPAPQTLTGIDAVDLDGFNGKPEDLKLRPEDAPDFSNYVARWEEVVPLYGRITKDVFTSKDGRLRYMFSRDRFKGKARGWISAVEVVDSDINDRGLKRQWVNAGPLATPAFEYYNHVTDLNGKYYGGEATETAEEYVDTYEHFLSKIPVIQEYMALTPPPPDKPEEEKKKPETPEPTKNETVVPEVKPAEATEAAANPEQKFSSQVINGIVERAAKTYEGKYPSALFGKNFDLTVDEIKEVQGLFEAVDNRVTELKASLPLYEKLIQMLEKDRETLGTLEESSRIIVDSSVTDIVRGKNDKNVPILRVPAEIKDLYIIEMERRDAAESLRMYDVGLMTGKSATSFGKRLNTLHEFVGGDTELKATEVKPETEAATTPDAAPATETEKPVEVAVELPKLTERQQALYSRIEFQKPVPTNKPGTFRVETKVDPKIWGKIKRVVAYQVDPGRPERWKVRVEIDNQEKNNNLATQVDLQNPGDPKESNQELHYQMVIALDKRLPDNYEVKPNPSAKAPEAAAQPVETAQAAATTETAANPAAAETGGSVKQEATVSFITEKESGINDSRLYPKLNVNRVIESRTAAGLPKVQIPLSSRDPRFEDAVMIATQREDGRWNVGLNGVVIPEGSGGGFLGTVAATTPQELIEKVNELLKQYATDLDRREPNEPAPQPRTERTASPFFIETAPQPTVTETRDAAYLSSTVEKAHDAATKIHQYVGSIRTAVLPALAKYPTMTDRHDFLASRATALDEQATAVESAATQTNTVFEARRKTILELQANAKTLVDESERLQRELRPFKAALDAAELQMSKANTPEERIAAQAEIDEKQAAYEERNQVIKANERNWRADERQINDETTAIDKELETLEQQQATLAQLTAETEQLVTTAIETIPDTNLKEDIINALVDDINKRENETENTLTEKRAQQAELNTRLAQLLREDKVEEAERVGRELKKVSLEILSIETQLNRQ